LLNKHLSTLLLSFDKRKKLIYLAFNLAHACSPNFAKCLGKRG